MVEYDRYMFHKDSRYDSDNYKKGISVERYRPYRSSRNDEPKCSYKLSRSNYSEKDYSYRSRSRSNSREHYKKEKYSRRERSTERYLKISNRSDLYYYDDEVISRSSIRYSKDNYDYEHSSRSPSYKTDSYLKEYKKLKSCTVKVLKKDKNVNSSNVYDKEFVDRDFSIKKGITSFRNDKENLLENGKSNLYISENFNDLQRYKKSLLGDGPKELRLYPLEFIETENCKKMCEETIELMNSKCDQIHKLNKTNEYILNNSPNSILTNTTLEDIHNSMQIIDYNHQKDISHITSVPLIPQDKITESKSFIKETPSLMPSSDELVSNSYYGENVLMINESIDNQIKSLADLLTNPVENEITWKLIPLFTPLRVRISEKDIDTQTCSEYDPRIAHIAQNIF